MLGVEADAASMWAKLRGWKNRVKPYLIGLGSFWAKNKHDFIYFGAER